MVGSSFKKFFMSVLFERLARPQKKAQSKNSRSLFSSDKLYHCRLFFQVSFEIIITAYYFLYSSKLPNFAAAVWIRFRLKSLLKKFSQNLVFFEEIFFIDVGWTLRERLLVSQFLYSRSLTCWTKSAVKVCAYS